MAAPEEAAVSRQGRRMGCLQDEVTRRVDEGSLLLRIAAPEHEHDRCRPRVHLLDNAVGEALPTTLAVRGGAAHFDRQHAVEQQYPLVCPMLEKAMARLLYAEVAFELLVNVDEARRGPDSGPHREAQSMCLALAVIGILAEDHDADVVDRCQVERSKPFARFGKYSLPRFTFEDQEALEIGHVGLLELAAQRFQPGRMQLDFCLIPHRSPSLADLRPQFYGQRQWSPSSRPIGSQSI